MLIICLDTAMVPRHTLSEPLLNSSNSRIPIVNYSVTKISQNLFFFTITNFYKMVKIMVYSDHKVFFSANTTLKLKVYKIFKPAYKHVFLISILLCIFKFSSNRILQYSCVE